MRRKQYLLLGCGNKRDRRLSTTGSEGWDGQLTTCDHDAACGADVLHDLETFPYPFKDDFYDEVHLYEVLEHIVTQGDFRTFFKVFSELHRVLKKGGLICLAVPTWNDGTAFCDPGHKAVFHPSVFTYLDQDVYPREIGKTARTDYRWCWQGDLQIVHCEDTNSSTYISLQKK
jgi:SAM-dependent methyltransferase